jgi:hypothetical protein
MCAP